MEAHISQFLVTVMAASIVALVTALAKLWSDFKNFQTYVAEKYVPRDSVNDSFDEIKEDLKSLRDVVYRVALRLEVPVLTEKWRG